MLDSELFSRAARALSRLLSDLHAKDRRPGLRPTRRAYYRGQGPTVAASRAPVACSGNPPGRRMFRSLDGGARSGRSGRSGTLNYQIQKACSVHATYEIPCPCRSASAFSYSARAHLRPAPRVARDSRPPDRRPADDLRSDSDRYATRAPTRAPPRRRTRLRDVTSTSDAS